MKKGFYGFTGTQRGMTRAQKSGVRSLLLNCTGGLHHGDCIGSDAEAHDIAEDCGLEIIIHPPSNPDKRAFKNAKIIMPMKPYLDRNKDIVNETAALIAAPGEDTEQLRSGTWSTIRYARKLGRPITIIFPDGALLRD